MLQVKTARWMGLFALALTSTSQAHALDSAPESVMRGVLQKFFDYKVELCVERQMKFRTKPTKELAQRSCAEEVSRQIDVKNLEISPAALRFGKSKTPEVLCDMSPDENSVVCKGVLYKKDQSGSVAENLIRRVRSDGAQVAPASRDPHEVSAGRSR